MLAARRWIPARQKGSSFVLALCFAAIIALPSATDSGPTYGRGVRVFPLKLDIAGAQFVARLRGDRTRRKLSFDQHVCGSQGCIMNTAWNE